tara:strand:- start:13142 stop:15988 length:2847 start_codon:yes stop_codon:yes gene_type:complete
MALSPQLQQFKSSGVYRLEFDKSQTVNIPAETIRLVVGRSKKGPYNIPVYIENVEQFTQIFGSVDKSLEKKGMFFHRSAKETLSRGPILALNLTVADDQDTVAMVSPATNSSKEGLGDIPQSVQYSSVFDTDKFWVPSDLKVLQAAGNTTSGSNHAITFTNIKQDPITIIVRQAANTAGFELTAREWYGEANIPEGIEELEYVSDYMVDVFIFKGKFDAAELNNDPTYGGMFTDKGLLRSEFAKFAGLREVSLLAQYTGSLIPEFMDNEGRQLYIETLVNIEARRTGLFCAINEDALAQIDLVGNTFDVYQDYQLLSHRVDQAIAPSIVAGLNKIINIDGDELEILDYDGSGAGAEILVGQWLVSSVDGEYVQITDIDFDGANTTLTLTGAPSESAYKTFSQNGETAASFANSPVSVDADGNIVIDQMSITQNGLPNNGKYLKSVNAGEFVLVGPIVENVDYNGVAKTVISPAGSTGFDPVEYNGNLDQILPFVHVATDSFLQYEISENDRAVMFPAGGGAYNYDNTSAGEFTFTVNTVSDDFDWSDIKVGMYVPADKDDSSPIKAARITRIKKEIKDDATIYRFSISRHIVKRPSYALKRYEESTSTYTMFPLVGATQTEKSIKELLDVMVPGSGLANTLVDKDAITFRYVVDTFGSLGVGGTILNKEQLSQLCKERQNASAILNAPMVKEFKAATNPSFKDSEGVFKARLVSTGGNLDLNPDSIYTLPSIGEGANFGFYYGPGLNVLENGRVKVIPPAAYVSNNYIDKYLDALPWSIIAGPRRGVVGGIGVQGLEFAFDKDDRDFLEPFGYNPIVFERGVGLTIKGNKTAQQGIQSALSSAHVREAMIYIEDGLAEILKNYLFEFNNAQTRLEIKTLADSFMESVKKDGGVYDYRNIMDGTNNTNEVIDNNMGILDTFVEPVKGLEILVSRVTILNTGEIATGNFA